MEVIIGRVLPNLRFVFVGDEQAEEQVDGVLLFGVGECVAVIPTQGLHDVVALGSPRGGFSVRFYTVDQLGTAVLKRQRVPVVLVKALQHSHAVRVELQVWAFQDSQCTQLVAQHALA